MNAPVSARERSMFRKPVLQLCGLVVASSCAAIAMGQQQSSSNLSLNQMALRNAQQIMQQSQQSQGGMPSAGRIGLGLDTSYSGQKPFTGFSQGPTVSPY